MADGKALQGVVWTDLKHPLSFKGDGDEASDKVEAFVVSAVVDRLVPRRRTAFLQNVRENCTHKLLTECGASRTLPSMFAMRTERLTPSPPARAPAEGCSLPASHRPERDHRAAVRVGALQRRGRRNCGVGGGGAAGGGRCGCHGDVGRRQR